MSRGYFLAVLIIIFQFNFLLNKITIENKEQFHTPFSSRIEEVQGNLQYESLYNTVPLSSNRLMRVMDFIYIFCFIYGLFYFKEIDIRKNIRYVKKYILDLRHFIMRLCLKIFHGGKYKESTFFFNF